MHSTMDRGSDSQIGPTARRGGGPGDRTGVTVILPC
jgi:hypothetical protein